MGRKNQGILTRKEREDISSAIRTLKRGIVKGFLAAGYTQSQVGQFFGVSKQRIHQIEHDRA